MKTIRHHFPTIDSTQDWAKSQLNTFDLNHFHVISAQEQTKGRGRFNRHWHSPKNVNIYVTYCFSIPKSDFSFNPLSLVTGLCIAEALQKLGMRAKLKWPNDIYIGNEKIGGILTETQEAESGRVFFVGFGLNVNMNLEQLSQIDCPATSLLAQTNKKTSIPMLMETIETIFKRNLSVFIQEGFAKFHPDFQEISLLTGKKVMLDLGTEVIEGMCKGVDGEGALILEDKDQSLHTYFSGEIISWEPH